MCPQGTGLDLQGTIDGTAVSVAFGEAESATSMAISPVGRMGWLGQAGNASASNALPGGLFAVDVDQGTGFLMMAQGGPNAGEVYFAGSFSATDPPAASAWWVWSGPGSVYTFTQLVDLGSCPAASGSGSISYCKASAASACPDKSEDSATGAVNGSAFDWAPMGTDESLPYTNPKVGNAGIFWPNGAMLIGAAPGAGHVVDDGTSGAHGDFGPGILIMPPTGPDAGAVWCLGSGTWSSNPNNDVVELDVQGMTRLGTVADGKSVSGTLTGTSRCD